MQNASDGCMDNSNYYHLCNDNKQVLAIDTNHVTVYGVTCFSFFSFLTILENKFSSFLLMDHSITWETLECVSRSMKLGRFVLALLWIIILCINNHPLIPFLSLQKMNVMPINFDAITDDVYQNDGSAMVKKIVVMEKMKIPAIVVSLFHYRRDNSPSYSFLNAVNALQILPSWMSAKLFLKVECSLFPF